MKILAIESSSRPNGLTANMAKAALEGACEAGAETELLALRDYKLECCRQCDETGWGDCRTKGSCVIDDDLAELVGKVRGADGLVFATPVYFGDLSEKAKVFTDRMRRVAMGTGGGAFLNGLRAVGIAAAGGSSGGTASCMVSLEKVLSVPGCFILDLIPVAQRNKDYKAAVCQLAGRAIVEGAASD